MAKVSSVYICQQCGYQSPSFLGRCPECGTWNSLVEQAISDTRYEISKKFRKPPEIIKFSDIEKKEFDRLSTGVEEFDRVLGGGVVRGSLILVSGDPGIGKSTLLSELSLNLENTLYIAGEESPHQIKIRLDRILESLGERGKPNLNILSETDVDLISQAIQDTKPTMVIVDSIQAMETQDLTAAAGSISQVRECAHRLQKIAKSLHIPIFLVGHVTKEGAVAGPRTLEHLVDVVLSLEGDPTSQFRVLRANKNRFGPTDEVGIFDMREEGLKEIKNPSELFLKEKIEAPGSAVAAILTGLRPMLLEIQALVTKSYLPMPRRSANGVDNTRLQLLAALLSKRLKLPLFDQDVFVNVTGGIRITERASDLAICMAIISSLQEKVIKPKTVFIGEVGLLGELRAVRNIEKRVKEARKLGFKNIISSQNAKNLTQAVKMGLD